MAFLLAVVAALVACSNAGMMQMMGGQQQGGNQMMGGQQQGGNQMMGGMVPMGNGGCQQDSDGNMPKGCEIPMNVDMDEYIEQQMQQQQFSNQETAQKIKAQFESMVKEVTDKKIKYVMSLVAEYTSACQCMGTSTTTYNAIFLQNARALNLTNAMDEWDASRKPYEARNEEEARGLIFLGVLNTICESIGNFMTFAQDVSNRIPAFRNNGKK